MCWPFGLSLSRTEENQLQTRNISAILTTGAPNFDQILFMDLSEIVAKLKTIYDPEIPVNIYDLGLIYDVQLIGTKAYLLMTLTTASCPAAAFLPEQVRAAVAGIPGIGDVHVEVTYEPRWTPKRMSEEARSLLGY